MIVGMVLRAASFLRRRDRTFVLRYVQTTTLGLMDGSVSTLAPLFATAFATRDARITFLVGLAAAVGAGISMGFSEGLSDDGSLTGRGHPFLRGTITAVATFVGGSCTRCRSSYRT